MSVSPRELLDRLYGERSALDNSGRPIALNSEISRDFAEALARVVRDHAPMTVIEIGMAFGASSLAILSELPTGGRLISIDPFQDHYGRVGSNLVAQSTRADAHELIEEPDYLALPRLLGDGVVADLVYVDGMHTFDYVALDAFYGDKLLNVGGILAFNDCGFRSIHKFLKYFRKHRRYEELDVGLPADHRGRNAFVTALRFLQQRSNQDRYFRKVESWEPAHNVFYDF